MIKKIVLSTTGLILGALVCTLWAQELTPLESLGKAMYKDTAFSYNNTQSCQSCHHPAVGFVDPDNTRDPQNSPVSVGADGISVGGRNAPSAAYAGFSPQLTKGADGEYVGGMFWDGRATGYTLGDPLAEQAQGPPLNPVEMAMPDKAAVVAAVAASEYADLFLSVFEMQDFDDVDAAYDNIGRAIAAYERSHSVQRFNSRFDRGRLTVTEQSGGELFKANCAACHPDTPQEGNQAVLFTTYGYANVGLPANPLLAGNSVDYGLGGFLESDYFGEGRINDPNFADHYGKFKIPTLRNVAATAPYGHNGVFATLTDMVAHLNQRTAIPEVDRNISEQVGDMGLDEAQIADIVAFLRTLSDTNKP